MRTLSKIILQLAMIAFNILRLIGQKALSFREDLPYKHKGKHDPWYHTIALFKIY